jgi:DNA-binding CsgD family transcriptional regulator
MMEDYFRSGWAKRDIRAERAIPVGLARGVATEPDFITPDEMRQSAYYNEWVERHGCRYFVGVGVRVEGKLWAISIQREAKHGLFDSSDIDRLAALCPSLGDAATLSFHLGFRQILGMAHAFDLIEQPAVLFDNSGRVLDINDAAHALLSTAIDPKTRTIIFADAASRLAYSTLMSAALGSIQRSGPADRSASFRIRGGQSIKANAITLRDWARFSFASARALLLFERDEPTRSPAFGFTPMEKRLADKLVAGKSLRESADALAIRYETARAYLRSIFLKTDTHRQSELVVALHNSQLNIGERDVS